MTINSITKEEAEWLLEWMLSARETERDQGTKEHYLYANSLVNELKFITKGKNKNTYKTGVKLKIPVKGWKK